MAILDTYQIQLLHLHPNSILILSIFAYLCEAYIGIRPSVELFRNFYALRSTTSNEVAGCISFRVADTRSKNYIPIAWVGENAVTKVMKKVDDFRKRWFLVDAKAKNHLLDMPVAPPKKWARWASEALEGPNLGEVYEGLRGLRDAGVTGQMVAKDFTRHRIVPSNGTPW